MELKTLETTRGHKIVLREATGLERRAYRRVALSVDDSEKVADRIDLLEDAMIDIFVESIDGKMEGLKEYALTLPAPCYQEMIDACKDVLTGLEKKSEEN